LTLYRIPTGLQARIDDVVVDGAARGRGIGEALSREAIRIAREAGARNVSLTSRPAREAANRLYQRIGFQRLDTNVYRYPLD
jgi:ribosomal protein S18 acetylase RimI-like enzyme